MNRREFLKVSASALAISSLPLSCSSLLAAPTTQPAAQFDHYFLTILDGFLRNAKATSGSFAVCDYPDGTKLKSCCNPAGKTYVSVARMMPAMVEWMHAKKEPASDIENILLAIFRHRSLYRLPRDVLSRKLTLPFLIKGASTEEPTRNQPIEWKDAMD